MIRITLLFFTCLLATVNFHAYAIEGSFWNLLGGMFGGLACLDILRSTAELFPKRKS